LTSIKLQFSISRDIVSNPWSLSESTAIERGIDWQGLFKSSWRDFTTTITHISENMRRHRALIESGGSLGDFEIMQNSRQLAIHAFEKQAQDQVNLRRDIVGSWLCSFSCERQQETHRATRLVCKDSGRWLLDDSRFKDWLSPDYCSKPLLWLNGKPGAGRPFLQSDII